MRRLSLVLLIILIGALPLGSAALAAQATENEDWVNVAQPTVGAPLGQLDRLEAVLAYQGNTDLEKAVSEIRESLIARNDTANGGYVVSFLQRLAHAPEMPGSGDSSAEFMAVYVRSGEFVLDNLGPSPFFVLPGDARDAIHTFNATLSDGDAVAHYTLDGKIACAGMCTITPPMAVQVLEDDWIIAPENELCVWCLLNQNASSGQSTGILYVYPLFTDAGEFSWIQSWNSAQESMTSGATPIASPSAASDEDTLPVTMMGWGMFNPAGNCRSP